MNRSIPVLLAGIGILAGFGLAAQDGEDSSDAEALDIDELELSGQRCLPLANIRRTEVIDDETIIFYVRNREAYINQLPRNCPGLERNERFMYEVEGARLCSTDWITVLERMGGIGPSRGFTCRLGEFFPIDADTLATLKGDGDGTGASGRGTVEVNPIELPPEDREDAEPED